MLYQGTVFSGRGETEVKDSQTWMRGHGSHLDVCQGQVGRLNRKRVKWREGEREQHVECGFAHNMCKSVSLEQAEMIDNHTIEQVENSSEIH